MSGAQIIERANVETLAHDILDALHEFQLREPGRNDSKAALEILNALGFCVAVVLQGTGQDPDARAFFDGAIDAQLTRFAVERVGFNG